MDAWRPNLGPQTRFLACGCFEALYGGSAGGGKSEALLIDALRYIDRPQYKALILRRTYPELARHIIERSQLIYRRAGGTYRVGDKVWVFPSGARVELGHMEHELDKHKFQSAEYQRCVARGTPVLMGDRTWQPIESIAAGDMVSTLCGPRKVRATWAFGVKPVVRLQSTAGAVVFASASHRMLTPTGWAVPSAATPSRCRACAGTLASSVETCWQSPRPQGLRSLGRPQACELNQQRLVSMVRRDFGALTVNEQTYCATFGDARLGSWQPQESCVPLMLHELGARLSVPENDRAIRPRAQDHATGGRTLQGCTTGCLFGHGSCGEQFLPGRAIGPSYTQQQVYAACGNRSLERLGGPASIRSRSRRGRFVAPHPYTRESLDICEAARRDLALCGQAGAAEVFDLTVDDAAHYVTWGGFIASNCLFDELTTFTEGQYKYMVSRIRSTTGIPLDLRAATNPGGVGHDWVLERFAPWLYPSDAAEYDGIRARPEQRLYARFDAELDAEVVEAEYTEGSLGRAFFPARIADNPYLAGTQYEANLNLLDRLTREQLKHGNWMARPAPGMFFRRDWFRVVDIPPAVVARCRYWDRAGTEAPDRRTNELKGPDWTAGLRMARMADGNMLIEHIERFRGEPAEVERRIKAVAERDQQQVGPTVVVLEQDPGQAGKFEAKHYLRELEQYEVRAIPPQGDKITRARPASAAAEQGRIIVLRGAWNEAFFREGESFPGGKKDQIDSLSGAYAFLSSYARVKPATGGERSLARGTGGF